MCLGLGKLLKLIDKKIKQSSKIFVSVNDLVGPVLFEPEQTEKTFKNQKKETPSTQQAQTIRCWDAEVSYISPSSTPSIELLSWIALPCYPFVLRKIFIFSKLN